MIILLGGTGYVGGQFARTLQERGIPFAAPLRSEIDYGQFAALRAYLEKIRPEFLINAAGYTGKPNVDACEQHWADTLQGNTLFPAAAAHACASLGIPYGHVSSGCIFSGARVVEGGRDRIERDLNKNGLPALLEKNRAAFRGFTEADEPNFTFRSPPCSFYSGSKALGEEALRGVGQGYIWRLRIPFDRFDNPRNYLSKLRNYAKVYQNVNSLSHRGDFTAACLDLWQKRAPFGTYNVTNPGFVTTRQVVEMMQKILRPARSFEFWSDDAEFYKVAAKTPRSNCILDATKLLSAGVAIRPVEDALVDSLKNWVNLK
ncbi:MAG: sugar nucleotide-binding protein [Verrucomicrobiota bacterium]|jgi:dTDP-4-dehydrorhamnose reductase